MCKMTTYVSVYFWCHKVPVKIMSGYFHTPIDLSFARFAYGSAYQKRASKIAMTQDEKITLYIRPVAFWFDTCAQSSMSIIESVNSAVSFGSRRAELTHEPTDPNLLGGETWTLLHTPTKSDTPPDRYIDVKVHSSSNNFFDLDSHHFRCAIWFLAVTNTITC